MFNQYGGVTTDQKTDGLLRAYRDQLLKHVKLIKSDSRMPTRMLPSTNELKAKLDAIIQQRQSLCADNYPSQSHHQSVEVELEQEQQKQLENQQEQEQRLEKAPKMPDHYISWPDDIWGLYFDTHSSLHFKSLNELMKGYPGQEYVNFDNDLLLTKNFYRNAASQTSYLDSYLKPLHALMFRLKANKLECVGLTTGELEELFRQACDNIWFTTIHGDPLAESVTPELSENHETQYHRLLEQAQYFAGDWSYLAQKSSYYWLDKDFQAKKTFFETYLGKSRCYDASLLDYIASKLHQRQADNPEQDVSATQSTPYDPFNHQHNDANGHFIRAVKNGQNELVQLLLNQGVVTPNLIKVNGQTPLHIAIDGGHSKMIKTLLDAGANPEIKDSRGQTALLQAINSGDDKVVTTLLAANANPDVKNNNGETALHVACQKRNLGIIKQLLMHGADLGNPDPVNRPPADYVNDDETIKQFLQIANAMQQAIINVNSPNGRKGKEKLDKLESFKQDFLKEPDETKRYTIAQDFAKKAQDKPVGQASSFKAFIDSLPQESWCNQLKKPFQANNTSQNWFGFFCCSTTQLEYEQPTVPPSAEAKQQPIRTNK